MIHGTVSFSAKGRLGNRRCSVYVDALLPAPSLFLPVPVDSLLLPPHTFPGLRAPLPSNSGISTYPNPSQDTVANKYHAPLKYSRALERIVLVSNQTSSICKIASRVVSC